MLHMKPRNGAILALGAILSALSAVVIAHAYSRSPGDERLEQAAIMRIADLVTRPPSAETVVVAGDSHAGAIAQGDFCGHPARDAAVGGMTVDLYRSAWDSAPSGASRPIRAIVLAIGTNDQQIKRRPAAHEADYHREMSDLVIRLRARTNRLLVLAIPPNHHPKVESDGVRRRNAFLRDLCSRAGCEVLDPFADSREPDEQTMRPGFSGDGVHYTDYRPIRERIERKICMK